MTEAARRSSVLAWSCSSRGAGGAREAGKGGGLRSSRGAPKLDQLDFSNTYNTQPTHTSQPAASARGGASAGGWGRVGRTCRTTRAGCQGPSPLPPPSSGLALELRV